MAQRPKYCVSQGGFLRRISFNKGMSLFLKKFDSPLPLCYPESMVTVCWTLCGVTSPVTL